MAFLIHFLLAALLAAGGGAPARAARAADSLPEAVQAAFVFNFTKFTDWPERVWQGSGGRLAVCFLTVSDPVAGELQSYVGKTSQGHPLVLRRGVALADLQACQVAFLDGRAAPRLTAFLDALGPAPVLTVSAVPGFAGAGGMIGLYRDVDDRMRFEINLAATRRAGLQLSAKLLRLARIVDGE